MNKKFFILFLIFIGFLYAQIYPNFNSETSNFSLMYSWQPIFVKSANDSVILDSKSVMMKVYYFVPYSVLAFQKSDEEYHAEYGLRSAIYHGSRQVSGTTASREFSIDNYEDTGDNNLFLIDSIFYKVPIGDFELFASIEDVIARRKMVKKDLELEIEPFNPEADLTRPIILDELGLIKKSHLRLDDTVYYSLGIIAPESDDLLLTVSIKEENDIQFSVIDSIKAFSRKSAKQSQNRGNLIQEITVFDDQPCFFYYSGKFCVCGKEVIDGGEKELHIKLENLKKGTMAEKSIQAKFHASYMNMTNSDFSKEIYLLSIVGKNKEVKQIKKSDPEARDSLIQHFWAKRDPNPSTEENEFKSEFLRRVKYANEYFSGWKPGYKSDRGRIYIEYGPPDEIEEHPFETDSYPYVKWYYYSLQTVYTFIDRYGNGEYSLWSID